MKHFITECHVIKCFTSRITIYRGRVNFENIIAKEHNCRWHNCVIFLDFPTAITLVRYANTDEVTAKLGGEGGGKYASQSEAVCLQKLSQKKKKKRS